MQAHTPSWLHHWLSVVTVACDMHFCIIDIAILKAVVSSCENRIPISLTSLLVQGKLAVDCDNDKRLQEFRAGVLLSHLQYLKCQLYS